MNPNGPGACPGVQRGAPDFSPSVSIRAGRTGRVVGLFGLIALCAAYDEGAIGDWGALHLRQDLGAGASLAAAGYAAFARAEASARLSGTALLERLGRTRVLIIGGMTACGHAPGLRGLQRLAGAGWVRRDGSRAGQHVPGGHRAAVLLAGSCGVALTSMLGYGGFLLGPPAIGFLASGAGLRAGLITLAFLGLAAAVIAWLSRDTPALSEGASLRPGS